MLLQQEKIDNPKDDKIPRDPFRRVFEYLSKRRFTSEVNKSLQEVSITIEGIEKSDFFWTGWCWKIYSMFEIHSKI